MSKTSELRDMSDEQVQLTWKEASENLFRLRLQAQTERLDAPSELRRHRRLIARCQTVLSQRRIAEADKSLPVASATARTGAAAATSVKPKRRRPRSARHRKTSQAVQK